MMPSIYVFKSSCQGTRLNIDVDVLRCIQEEKRHGIIIVGWAVGFMDHTYILSFQAGIPA